MAEPIQKYFKGSEQRAGETHAHTRDCLTCHQHSCSNCVNWFHCQCDNPRQAGWSILYCPSCARRGGQAEWHRHGGCGQCGGIMYGCPIFKFRNGVHICHRCAWGKEDDLFEIGLCTCNRCRGTFVTLRAPVKKAPVVPETSQPAPTRRVVRPRAPEPPQDLRYRDIYRRG